MARGWIISGAVLILIGCSSTSQQPPGKKNILQVINYLTQYAQKNDNKSPPDDAAFKKFLADVRKSSDHDEVLVSPVDNEPYVIRYGMSHTQKVGKEGLVPPSQASSKIKLVQEKTGRDGKVWVGYVGSIAELEDAASVK